MCFCGEWVFVAVSCMCAGMHACTCVIVPLNNVHFSVRACVCVITRVCSLQPLIFHILHGQEGQEAARLRPEPGYSTVSNARHSLAPPKLSALLPNVLASSHALAPCTLLLSPPVKAFSVRWLHSATAEASSSWLGPFQL